MHVMDSGDKQLIKLTGVLYVLQLHEKLLFVQKLTNKGFEVHFGGENVPSLKQMLLQLVLLNVVVCISSIFYRKR